MTSAASPPARSSGSRGAAARRAGARPAPADLARLLILAGLVLPTLVAASAGASVAAAAGTLPGLRAARRAAVRAAALAPTAEPARFGLLVVPVDFADARLPRDWDPQLALAPRLLPGSSPTLADYWRTASRGRLDLQVLVAPTVHLQGERLDYSDLGFGGDHVKSRRLAREAIAAVAALGLDFRLLDMEGPDRVPGSGDDDGEVDGVLILHAGPGQENDASGGLIEALQYWLEEPVLSRGTAARFYATASLRSGVGVWAHEVGHLLGLEDRYDLDLPGSAGDAAPAGGLGVFSLMAAGAFGTGAAEDPSLLDAYSAAALGWLDVVPLRGDGSEAATLAPALAAGRAYRVWTEGLAGPEYFLLEVRGGPEAGPYDAAVPAGQLVVYHVDEDLPEGTASASTWPRHLRVGLLEADDDGALARGLDRGRPEDLFPGPLGVTAILPGGSPPSDGYDGLTGIRISGIEAVPGGVSLGVGDHAGPAAGLALAFDPETPRTLRLEVSELGAPWSALVATIRALGATPWGSFAGGAIEVELPLARDADGVWRPLAPPAWDLDPAAPPGAGTDFAIVLTDGDWRRDLQRHWTWRESADALDFGDGLPADWVRLDQGAWTGNTAWHRWADGAGATADGSPVLACTGSDHVDGSAWPAVAHGGRADVVLVTGFLPAGAAAVRLVHSFDGDHPTPGTGRDGGVLEFELADGTVVPAAPLDGYGGRVDARADCALHGREAFVGADSLVGARPLAWRLDVVPVPAEGRPARLRLRFASDTFTAGRGWLVADLAAVALPEGGSALPVAVIGDGDGGRLAWRWPWPEAAGWSVQRSVDGGASWSTAAADLAPAPAAGWPLTVPLAGLLPPGGADGRVSLRVVAETELGRLASRPVALSPDDGPLLSLAGPPYPSPARGEVRMLLDLPDGRAARLQVIDLRGRVLRRWDLLGGRRLWLWDGRDGAGRRLAAGTYLLRLEVGGRAQTRKVVLLR